MSLIGTALLLAAVVQGAPERTIAPGQRISRTVRPCIDYAGRGFLQYISLQSIDDPDDLLGHSIYRWRYRERQRLVGRWPTRSRVLARIGHAMREQDRQDELVFVAAGDAVNPRWVDSALIWTDVRGTEFIPIFRWPDPTDRAFEWLPDAARRFAKPVNYRSPQPPGGADALTVDDEVPGVIETRRGRTVVLRGIFLADLPRLLDAARAEPCWR